ncbi:MAG: hypothetical protein ACRC42_02345 [Mycoplasma sp.]
MKLTNAKKSKSVILSIRVSEEELEFIEGLAKEIKMSKANLIRKSLNTYHEIIINNKG